MGDKTPSVCERIIRAKSSFFDRIIRTAVEAPSGNTKRLIDSETTLQESAVKRKVIARAVHLLREHLRATQAEFAVMIGTKTDVGTVSRWERGDLSPRQVNRERLAVLAKESGREDLESAFFDPGGNWKLALASVEPRVCDLITKLELCALAVYLFEDEVEAGPLIRAADAIINGVVDLHQAGQQIPLLSAAQRELWFKILAERGVEGGNTRRQNNDETTQEESR